jgi:hypothetical protein
MITSQIMFWWAVLAAARSAGEVELIVRRSPFARIALALALGSWETMFGARAKARRFLQAARSTAWGHPILVLMAIEGALKAVREARLDLEMFQAERRHRRARC